MKKGTVISIVLIVLCLVGVFVYYILSQEQKYNWNETYSSKSDQPYGTSIFKNTLSSSINNDSIEFVSSSIARYLTPKTSGAYVLIAKDFYLSEEEIDSLLQFVKNGNQALIISSFMQFELQELLFQQDLDSNYYPLARSTSEIRLRLNDSKFGSDSNYVLQFVRKDKVLSYNWELFNEAFFSDSLYYKTLGTFSPGNEINFLKISYGKGEFLLHSTPLCFSNYYMLKEQSFEYTNEVLTHLKKGKIYYDTNPYSYEYGNNYSGSDASEGPLTYLLSIRSMRWAWYLMLFLVVVYLIFNLKRVQRVIPIQEKNENSSLAFVSSIGRLYFNSGKHQNIAIKEMELFLFHVRKKYSMNTSVLDENFVNLLATKAEVDPNVISEILEKYKAVEFLSEFSDEMLINFHQLLERFYQNSK